MGLGAGMRVCLVNVPEEVRSKLRVALANCSVVEINGTPIDFVTIFATDRAQLAAEFRRTTEVLVPTGAIWACWPKKSSGVVTDLDDTGVRHIGMNAGLVDVKVCAITEKWSGLKFMHRLKDR
jgi:hypothetical protein